MQQADSAAEEHRLPEARKAYAEVGWDVRWEELEEGERKKNMFVLLCFVLFWFVRWSVFAFAGRLGAFFRQSVVWVCKVYGIASGFIDYGAVQG